jgi:hypothetical protein
MSSFEEDIAQFIEDFKDKAPQHCAVKDLLLQDFLKRFEQNKVNLKKRLDKPNPFGGIALGLPKKK